MKKILYISSNDGSDMRINKEVRSLQKKYEVIFVGLGINDHNCYIKDFCEDVYLVNGNRKNIVAYLKQIIIVIKLLLKFKINSIHVINEKLVLIYYPLLFFKHTVLDLFDSVFLEANMANNKSIILKRIVYAPINCIIVTDSNRYELMPDYLKPKLLILPNYPNLISLAPKKTKAPNLRIMYFGWMGLERGTEIIEGLILVDKNIKVYMAGWFSDKYTENIIGKYKNQIEYLGILKQVDALKFASEHADFILCVYAPTNENNINASPNKIYDSILISTPVIINKEVIISKWVKDNKIGIIIDNYEVSDYVKLKNDLYNFKESFSPSSFLKMEHNWENIEENLWKAHTIKK